MFITNDLAENDEIELILCKVLTYCDYNTVDTEICFAWADREYVWAISCLMLYTMFRIVKDNKPPVQKKLYVSIILPSSLST